MTFTREQLKAAYEGSYGNNESLPYLVIQSCVEQMTTFLLGDSGEEKRIKFIANNPEQQQQLNEIINSTKLYNVLPEAITEMLIYGGAYIAQKDGVLRHIRQEDVSEVRVHPDNPLEIVYFKEKRKVYNPLENKNVEYEVEHSLQTDEDVGELDLLNLPAGGVVYSYRITQGDSVQDLPQNYIPIYRVVNTLKGTEVVSAIDRIVFAQIEYNFARSDIYQNGQHMKPLLWGTGTSAPQTVSRLGGEYREGVLDESGIRFRNDPQTILFFPTETTLDGTSVAAEIKYAQAVDSTYLEREVRLINQDIYNACGCILFELQNARSASSSSSMSVLYEPLRRYTLQRARYLLLILKAILTPLLGDLGYRVTFPNMMPKNIDEERQLLESAKARKLSVHTYLMRTFGMTDEEADAEIERLRSEEDLNVFVNKSDSLDVLNPNKANERLDGGSGSPTGDPSVQTILPVSANARL